MADTSRIEDLKRRVQSDPASIAFAALAEEYRRAGQYEEAIATCTAGLQRHPAYLSARVTLGRALLEVSRFDEAKQELEYVLKVAPENLAAIRGLADIHHRRGDRPEEEHYRAALDAAQRDTHGAEHHPTSRQAASHQVASHQVAGRQPAPQPAPHHAAAKPVKVSAPAAPAVAAPVAPVAGPPAAAPRPVIQPVRVQQSAATPAPVPAADPALAGLEAFLSAILRAREELESTSLRS